MAFRLSCPSCNASFGVPELPDDRRAHCPRCGDTFPIRSFTEAAEAEAAQRPALAQLTRKASGRWSVQRTVAVALAMGLIGLFAGLGVYYAKGGFRAKPVPEPDALPQFSAIAPTQLTGIGYLPADAAIVFAIQPGPVLAYAQRKHLDPRELIIQAGIPRQVLDAIAGLGLTLPQIDHIVGSTNVSEIRFAMVLVLRRPPADEDEFLKHLNAKRANGAKVRYSVMFGGLPLSLARVSPTVWIFGFDAKKDLAAVDYGGYGVGGKQFAEPLAEMISQRVPPDAAAWAATTEENWGEQALVRLALGQMGQKDWQAVLSRGRAAAAALALADPPRLRLFVKLADESSAAELRRYFARKAAADDLARTGGAGEFAFFDAPIDPATLFATLQHFLADAGKK